MKLQQSSETEVLEKEVLRKEFIPKRGRNKHEGEENCIQRKFVSGKPNNGMRKVWRIRQVRHMALK